MEEFHRLYHKDGHSDAHTITETTQTKKNLHSHDKKSNISSNTHNMDGHDRDNDDNHHHHHTLSHDDDNRIQMIHRIKQCCHDGYINWKNMMKKTIAIQARTSFNTNYNDYYNDNDDIEGDKLIYSSLSNFIYSIINHQDSKNNNNNDDDIYDYIIGYSLPSSSSHKTTTSLSTLLEMINKIITIQNDEGNRYLY